VIVFVGVIAFGLGGLVGYLQSTRRGPVGLLTIALQLAAGMGLLVVSGGYSRAVAAFFLGTCAGAAATHVARRRAEVPAGD
jgi:hypothetical protein